jgi:hypothetical protein
MKYVTIESPGKIPVLGGLLGPITTPCYLEIDIIISLINSGKAVYEVNPRNIKEKTRLTRQTVLNYNYNIPIKNNHNNTIEVDDVSLSQTVVPPSTVQTDIVQEAIEGMNGADIFLSNKYS